MNLIKSVMSTMSKESTDSAVPAGTGNVAPADRVAEDATKNATVADVAVVEGVTTKGDESPPSTSATETAARDESPAVESSTAVATDAKSSDAAQPTAAKAADTTAAAGDLEKKAEQSRLAAQEISSVLEKGRSRQDVEAENKKLRSDLSSMRRRLTAVQEQLNDVKSIMEKHCEAMPAEVRNAWQTALLKFEADHEALDKELGTAGDRTRRTKNVQRKTTAKKAKRQDGGKDVGSGGHQNMKVDGRAGHIALLQAAGVPLSATGGNGLSGGSASAIRRRNRRTKAEFRQRSSSGGPAKTSESAAQLAEKEIIRDELRAASTLDTMQAAVEKAKSSGMNHEVELATKKLTKLRKAMGLPELTESSTSAVAADGGGKKSKEAVVVASDSKPSDSTRGSTQQQEKKEEQVVPSVAVAV